MDGILPFAVLSAKLKKKADLVNGKVPASQLPEGGGYTLLSGKKAVFLGDSQTEANSHKTKIWWEWVKDLLSLGTCVNYGLGGSTITNNGSSSMSVRYSAMPNDADIVFVMGGVNDVWYSQPLGTITDTADTTFYGACRKLCRDLRNKYNKKPVIFINCTAENNASCVSTLGYEAKDFASAMKEACWIEGVLCLDAYGSLGIDPAYDASCTTDGLHLNDAGQELLGKWVAEQVRTHVRTIFTTVPVTGISLNKASTTIRVGSTETLKATLTPSGATGTVVWTTSDTSKATVSSAGVVTAVASGSATITASCAGYSASCAVTVSPLQEYITINDIASSIGITGLTVTDGTISWPTVRSAADFSVVELNSNIQSISGTLDGKFMSLLPYKISSTQFIGYDMDGAEFTFTLDSSGTKYNAAANTTPVLTRTGTWFTQPDSGTVSIVIENNVMTVTHPHGSFTVTPANHVGEWASSGNNWHMSNVVKNG